ncbi:hypothetical protein P3S67_014988 [Capsicum chacoense]
MILVSICIFIGRLFHMSSGRLKIVGLSKCQNWWTNMPKDLTCQSINGLISFDFNSCDVNMKRINHIL